jgi:photosystem II stability/assembly factor-like uncharacterized protein
MSNHSHIVYTLSTVLLTLLAACNSPTPATPTSTSLPAPAPTATSPSAPSPFQPHASQGWCWQEVLGLVNSLNDAFFLDGQTGWAVGERGTILHTDDGGQTWRRQVSPVNADLGRVAFVDARDGWIVGTFWNNGRKGVLLETKDGGQVWVERPLPFDVSGWYVDMIWADARSGWLVVGWHVFHTADGGQTWQEQPLPPGYSQLSSITSADGQHAWIVANDAVLRTSDGGQTWTTHTLDSDLYPEIIAFADAQRGWVMGEFGAIAHTYDGGQTWRVQRPGISGPVQDAVFLDARTGWALSYNQMWSTVDGGATWEARETPLDRHSIVFVDARRGWAVGSMNWVDGERVTIAHTDDGGVNWEIQDSHVEMLPLAYTTAVHLTTYLTQRDPPLEILLVQLLQGPCRFLDEEEWIETALRNLGWNGTGWDAPPFTPASSLDAIHRLEADLDGDGQDEIVIYSDPGLLGILDWDGAQWQVSWSDRNYVTHRGEMQLVGHDFDNDGQPELLVEQMRCGHTGCFRNIFLVHCDHLSCRSVWSEVHLAAISGGEQGGVVYTSWSGGDYRFVDLREIQVRRYGMSFQVARGEGGYLPETLEAKVMTTTQTIHRWDGTQYTPVEENVLEPGYVLDTRPVTETVDIDGDGVQELAVYRWKPRVNGGARQTLTLHVRDDAGAWRPIQVFKATVLLQPSAGVFLQDEDGSGPVQVVQCTDASPEAPHVTLDTWPSMAQLRCTVYVWDPVARVFVPRSDE